jgi:hypothetical protein
MNLGKIRYQSVLFGDFMEYLPSTERIMALLETYKDKKLIPITFFEYLPPNPNAFSRIAFVSENYEWQFKIKNLCLEIIHNSLSISGDNLGSIQSFVEKSADIFNRFLSKYGRKGNRLSLIGELYYDDKNKEKYDGFYLKLRNPHNKLYEEKIPFEWTVRDVTREKAEEGNFTETFNLITEINRLRGQVLFNNEAKPSDRINIFLDINSIPENIETRFDKDRIMWGLDKAVSYFSSLMAGIEEMQG